MNLASLWDRVKTRAESDTAAGAGLFASDGAGDALITGIFENVVPDEQPYPYVVYDVESAVQQDPFRLALYPVFFRFGVWVPHDPNVATTAGVKAAAIIARLRGDWEAQAVGVQPTYGFHRWSPGAVGSFTARDCSHQSSRAEHERSALHYVETYRVLVQRSAA